MNIAVYGGTFDPPTVAHKNIVEALVDQTVFDKVWIMPSADRDDKPHMSTFEHRYSMVKAMASELLSKKLVVSDIEASLGAPTQTTRTYEALKNIYPNESFWFVFGADSYADMPNWRNGTALRAIMNFCIIPRVGYETPQKNSKLKIVPVLSALEFVTSSTKVRELRSMRQPIGKHVTGKVKKYILQHSLYV